MLIEGHITCQAKTVIGSDLTPSVALFVHPSGTIYTSIHWNCKAAIVCSLKYRKRAQYTGEAETVIGGSSHQVLPYNI